MKILTKQDVHEALQITPSGCIASKWLKGYYHAINLYLIDGLYSIELEIIPFDKCTIEVKTRHVGTLEECLEIYNSMR